MRTVATALIVLLILALVFLFFIYLGLYNVGAALPHNAFAYWVFSTTMDNSVRRHAEEIKVPPLSDPALERQGAGFYREACVSCHGAPGVERSGIGSGLSPMPSDLAKTVPGWTSAELFWIVNNGIDMSGMPSFRHIYQDMEIWSIVAFLERLPGLTPPDYETMLETPPQQEEPQR